MNLEKEAVLIFGLSLNQGSGDRASRLQEMNAVFVALEHLGNRLVFMSPNNQMEKLWYHALSDRVAPRDAKMHTLVLVLVQN
jgi:hypothetical protein